MKAAHMITCFLLVTITTAAATILPGTSSTASGEDKPAVGTPTEAALARTRKMTAMLDNIYKQAVVLITDKYVHDEDDFAAGSAAVLLFKNVSASGSHQVRLIDASGKPTNDDNVAKDNFEREGIKHLKGGDANYEKVVTLDGKPQLRTLTPVPVVMKKCVMCHDHYADAKKGEPIGAISYIVPIE